MYSIIKLISVFLLLNSFQLKAENFSLLFGGWSNHQKAEYKVVNTDKKIKYNENHKMIGIKFNNFVLSTFKNSFYNQSIIMGYDYKLTGFKIHEYLNIQVGAVVGLVEGYTKIQINKAYIGNNISLYVLPKISSVFKINNKLSLSVDNGLIFAKNGYVLTTSLNLTFKM